MTAGCGLAMTRKGRPRDDGGMARGFATTNVVWPRKDEGLSLRAKRGNPCSHEVMDRHGLTASR